MKKRSIGIGMFLISLGIISGGYAVYQLPSELEVAEKELVILSKNKENTAKLKEVAIKNDEIADTMYWNKFCRIYFLKKADNLPLQSEESEENAKTHCGENFPTEQ